MKVVPFTIPVAKETTIVVQDNVVPHFYNHLHRHPEVQITWIKDGEGMLIAGNYMQRFKPGDVYIIGANQSHVFKSDDTYYDPSQNKIVHEISFFFNPDHLFQNLLRLPEMGAIRKFVEGVHNGLQIKDTSDDLVKKTMTDIMEKADSLRVAAFIELLHLFSTLKNLKPLSTNNNEQIMSDVEGIRMDQIFQFVVGNYKNHITLNEVASIANLTPQAFCRYFKKHTGKTLISFLNEVRINEACKIVVSNRFDSFSDVSYKTGFDNVTNFNRVFKKTIGKSPREYHRDFFKKLL